MLCIAGLDCRKIRCGFQHPPNFVPVCHFSPQCLKDTCGFRHVANPIPADDGKTISTVHETKRHIQVKGCKNRDLFLCLDMSGSMCGRPLLDVKSAVADIHRTVVKRGDCVELSTFSSEVHAPVLSLGPHDAKNFQSAVRGLRAAGRTALWDAIIAVIDQAAAQSSNEKKRFCEVVLMTDGDNTSSRHSYAEACAKVQKPGCVLKFFIISCGSSPSTRRKLERLCERAHCKLFIEDDVSGMLEAFGKVKRELVTTITTVQTRAKKTTKTAIRRRRLQ
jgi:Mg-chelatase subunit ChlD